MVFQRDKNENINYTDTNQDDSKKMSSSKVYKYIITIDLCINYLFYVSINGNFINNLLLIKIKMEKYFENLFDLFDLFQAVSLYIMGPTLFELKKIYGVGIDEISIINTIRATTFTLGALSKN